MAQFYAAEPLEQSVAELDDAALRNGGVLCSIGYGYAVTEWSRVTERGGWRLRWVDRRGMGNHGTAVLIPTDSRTRALWRDGQMIWFRAHGIPERYLERMISCRESRRHELVATLAAVLSDSTLVRAVLDFGQCGGGQGLGGERDRWREKWAPLCDEIQLSEPRMWSLRAIVEVCAGRAS